MYWIIFIGFAIASFIVSKMVESRFDKYSQTPISMTGKEVAEQMLRDNGIDDVTVCCVDGKLTDHYNPMNKTLNLSEGVYDCANIAAAAVAAHECGHAVQHARGYAFLKMRSAMVPAVSFSSKYVSWILLGGIIFINSFPQLMLIGICLFALTTLFSFVTLPVEIDASSRALAWLKNSGVSSFSNHQMAVKALRSAAYTYVVAALSSLATLLYYVIIYLGRRD
ncbi:MAG: zinc metallopeptidase [Paludibacteraceae bacterium]|nr:zinc metallopeptidase [Paludibacteraceae bacterium]